MEKATKKIGRAEPINPEERWIRLQEIGLSQILAFPVALILGVMFQLSSALLILITLALMIGGYCCFKWGHDKRREIQEQKEITQNTHNEQSS